MDEHTLASLQGSIAKWEAIVAGTGKDDGPLNCPLCIQFHPDYRTDGKQYCEGCPVTIAGYRGCTNHEYAAFCEAEEEASVEGSEDAASRMHFAAVAELAFLKSLLPSEAP